MGITGKYICVNSEANDYTIYIKKIDNHYYYKEIIAPMAFSEWKIFNENLETLVLYEIENDG